MDNGQWIMDNGQWTNDNRQPTMKLPLPLGEGWGEGKWCVLG